VPPAAATSLSVIVPTFNCAPYLPAALDSLLQQTRPADEIIVVDDGSTDDTATVLEAYTNRARVVRQSNQGASAARNAALAAASGRYVAFLDADDICAADRFEKQLAALTATPEAVACFTGHYTFDTSGRRTEYVVPPSAGIPPPLVQAARCLVFPPTLLFDRTKGSGLTYPAGVTCGEDMLFVAQLRTRGSFLVVPEALYGYRRRPGQATQAHSVINGFEQRLHWVERHWDGPQHPGDSTPAETMWREFAATLKDLYWARERDKFLLIREHLNRHWPANLARPAELGWHWYPDWLWNAKERMTAWRGP
jgi:glycosyltransferase involved in cell wall biosynthesis